MGHSMQFLYKSLFQVNTAYDPETTIISILVLLTPKPYEYKLMKTIHTAGVHKFSQNPGS